MPTFHGHGAGGGVIKRRLPRQYLCWKSEPEKSDILHRQFWIRIPTLDRGIVQEDISRVRDSRRQSKRVYDRAEVVRVVLVKFFIVGVGLRQAVVRACKYLGQIQQASRP